MRVLVFAGLLVVAAPAVASAGGRGAPAASHLDQALGACQRDVFEHGPDVVGDFDVYRRELAAALSADPMLRESQKPWRFFEDPTRNLSIGEWIARCDGWYPKKIAAARRDQARERIRFAIAWCQKAHRAGDGAGRDVLGLAASSYQSARDEAFELDASVRGSTEPIFGTPTAKWVQTCDAWFAQHAPSAVADEMPTVN